MRRNVLTLLLGISLIILVTVGLLISCSSKKEAEATPSKYPTTNVTHNNTPTEGIPSEPQNTPTSSGNPWGATSESPVYTSDGLWFATDEPPPEITKPPITSSWRTPPPPEIIKNEQERIDDVLKKLSELKIDKVQLISSTSQGWQYPLVHNYYESIDSVIIDRWIALVKSFEISIIAFNPTSGSSGYRLTFFSNGEEILIGRIQGSQNWRYIFVPGENGTNVTLRIENHVELRETFKELERAVGFPVS